MRLTDHRYKVYQPDRVNGLTAAAVAKERKSQSHGVAMHIGIVGGLDRNEGVYEDLAQRAGHHFEHHNGHLAGRGTASLDTLVERSDLVLVLTDVNSHAAVWRARRLAKQRGSRCILMSRCGPSKFASLLAELSEPQSTAANDSHTSGNRAVSTR